MQFCHHPQLFSFEQQSLHRWLQAVCCSKARGSVRTAAERKAAEREAAERHADEARVLAIILANDYDASEAVKQGSKKQKKSDQGLERMRSHAMATADRESCIQRALDLADARVVAAESSASAVEQPKFGTGQAVLKWWAHWFADTGVNKMPMQLKGKKRPAWYSAEIIRCAEILDITYDGLRTADHMLPDGTGPLTLRPCLRTISCFT
jgi:cobalamin biosynthesis Mg chelatase CobN